MLFGDVFRYFTLANAASTPEQKYEEYMLNSISKRVIQGCSDIC